MLYAALDRCTVTVLPPVVQGHEPNAVWVHEAYVRAICTIESAHGIMGHGIWDRSPKALDATVKDATVKP